MLFKLGNIILNTDMMMDAKFVENGERAALIMRFPVAKPDGNLHRIKLTGDTARHVWELLNAEAEEMPYSGEDEDSV